MNKLTTLFKAQKINKNPIFYGSFAEIGAGQETAHYFFKAGLASQTIAKTISAYDMTFSDAIYGRQTRYVCKDRLITMLDHEYKLLEKRLNKKKGDKTQFFAFATTATTKSQKKQVSSQFAHAWMGLRFQHKAQSHFGDVMFHVDCLDKHRLKQHEALGILGVNLIYACFYNKDFNTKWLLSLKDNLLKNRITISDIHFKGSSFKKNMQLTINQELLKNSLGDVACFDFHGNSHFVGDIFFKKTITLLCADLSIIKKFYKDKKHLEKQNLKSLLLPCLSTQQLSKPISLKDIKNVCDKKSYLLLLKDNSPAFLNKFLSSFVDKKSLNFISL